MKKNRIRDLRRRNGFTQEQLAERTSMSPEYLSRIERGERGLSVKVAEKLASALGSTTAEVLGLEAANGAVAASGFAEDTVPYEAASGDPLIHLLGPNKYLWKVTTNVLDNVHIQPGDVLVVNDAQTALDRLKPLQAVQVAYHAAENPEHAVRLLRQFVPPRLLITNSSTGNMPVLDMNEDDAQIVGVIESHHRMWGAN